MGDNQADKADPGQFFGEPTFNYHDVARDSATILAIYDFGNGLSLRSNLRYSDLTNDFGYLYITDTASRTGTVVDRDYFGTDSSAEELIGNVVLQYDTTFGTVASSSLAGLEFRDATSRGEVRTSPFPGQTYPATSVMGVPRAVNPLRTAIRTWNSAT